jgi:hypothetical protein
VLHTGERAHTHLVQLHLHIDVARPVEQREPRLHLHDVAAVDGEEGAPLLRVAQDGEGGGHDRWVGLDVLGHILCARGRGRCEIGADELTTNVRAEEKA